MSPNKQTKRKKPQARIFSFKQTLCNMFRFRRIITPNYDKHSNNKFAGTENCELIDSDSQKTLTNRALPPLPLTKIKDEQTLDFATSISKVKDVSRYDIIRFWMLYRWFQCGWYWGPLSSEAAEKILSNEPDGSFIVRDSSDDHYIFSLTSKLNNSVRHVGIEDGQGELCEICHKYL